MTPRHGRTHQHTKRVHGSRGNSRATQKWLRKNGKHKIIFDIPQVYSNSTYRKFDINFQQI